MSTQRLKRIRRLQRARVRDEAGTRPLSSNAVFPSVRPISHKVLEPLMQQQSSLR